MVNDETRGLNPCRRQALKQLVDIYQEPVNINKITEIQDEVDSIKIDMKSNINKMVKNVEDGKELESKSQILKLETTDYHKKFSKRQKNYLVAKF